MNTEIRIAARNVLRNPRRTGIALLAVAFGIAALVLALGFIEWVLWAMRETTIHSQLGHVQIARRGFGEAGAADPFRYLLPADTAGKLALAEVPEVRVIAPRIEFSGLASLGDTTVSFIAEGVDPRQEAAMHKRHRLGRSVNIVQGADLPAEGGNAAILGQGLAAALGAKPGDRIVLLATPASGGVGAIELEVRGVFVTISKAFDDSALRVPLDVASRLLSVTGAHKLVLVLDDTDSTARVLQALAPRAHAAGLELLPWHEASDFYNKTVVLFGRQTGVITVIIAVLIVLGISSVMIMAVHERTPEIGTVLALGVSRRRVLLQFVLEGCLLGLVGALFGVLVGVGAAWAVSRIGIPMPPPPGQSWGYVAEILVTPSIVVRAVLLAVVAATVTAIYPAWKASRLPIVDALRTNR